MDGVFYFYDVHDDHFHRDDGHHFRRDQSPGFTGIPHRNVARGMQGNPSHALAERCAAAARESGVDEGDSPPEHSHSSPLRPLTRMLSAIARRRMSEFALEGAIEGCF